MAKTPAGSAGAFAPVALVFLGGLIIGVLMNLFIPLPIWPSTWIQLLAGGIWFFAWARAAFLRHRTALMPWNPSAELVQDGPYRFTRNPIYLALALM